jgi:hypothetical protein
VSIVDAFVVDASPSPLLKGKISQGVKAWLEMVVA